MRKHIVVLMLALVMLLTAFNSVNADIISTAFKADLAPPYDPSFTAYTGDLLETSLSSASLTGTAQWGSSLPKLYDGLNLAGSTWDDTTQSLAPTDGTVAVFVLNTSVHTLGYDIVQTVSLTGAGGGQNRRQQAYDLAVKYMGGSSFVDVASILPSLTNNDSGEGEVQVWTYESVTGKLASGVKEIQLTFHDPFSGGSPMYREFDVLGAATVPEPSTLALLACGLLSLLAYAYRKRK